MSRRTSHSFHNLLNLLVDLGSACSSVQGSGPRPRLDLVSGLSLGVAPKPTKIYDNQVDHPENVSFGHY